MIEYDVRKTQFAVSDFVSWQREGSLNINPPFQRRSVWKPDAKSFFVDTVVKGLPAPIIYLRQQVDLNTQKTIREVVDGQQRLRTIFAYIDPSLLKDFDANRDGFVVRSVHNQDLSGKSFQKLSKHFQERILSYEFSTHILPLSIEDREVLEIFARLNATGVKLNHQELRNAEYFGEFKSSMYRLALEQLDNWRNWGILTDDQISRMKEVETSSDLVMNMIMGLTGKTQRKLDDIYKNYDEKFAGQVEVERRFRQIFEEIDSAIGNEISKSAFSSEIHFFTLFVYLYDELYGLGSKLTRQSPRKLSKDLGQKILDLSRRLSSLNVPANVIDAFQRSSTDYGRRKTRLDYMKEQCSG
jgi:uncharacterized protein with ParB-like and HNH nuclease domain